jgi:hypothetical protein
VVWTIDLVGQYTYICRYVGVYVSFPHCVLRPGMLAYISFQSRAVARRMRGCGFYRCSLGVPVLLRSENVFCGFCSGAFVFNLCPTRERLRVSCKALE